MRYSLRTLLILMLLAGPLGAWGWKEWQAYRARVAQAEAVAREAQQQQRSIARLNAQIRAAWNAQQLPSQPGDPIAEQEIWESQRDKIRWESFPESQPPRP